MSRRDRRREQPAKPRLPLPLQRAWVKRSDRAEEERTRARRKLRPGEIAEESE